MLRSFQWAASPGLTAEDITVGVDGRPRVLRTNPNGNMGVWTVDTAGHLTDGQTYSNFGYVPRRISAGADGLTRVSLELCGRLWQRVAVERRQHGQGEARNAAPAVTK